MKKIKNFSFVVFIIYSALIILHDAGAVSFEPSMPIPLAIMLFLVVVETCNLKEKGSK